MPKIHNFHSGLPGIRQLLSFATAGAHCFASRDKAVLNGEQFKKSLWNMIFFLFRPQNEITSTIVIRSAQAPATYPIRHPISSYAEGRRGVFFTS